MSVALQALKSRSSVLALIIALVACLTVVAGPAFATTDDVTPEPTASATVVDDGAVTSPEPSVSSQVRTTNKYGQNLVNGIAFGLLLALASVGLSLIYGTTGLSNFAHGEQVTFGAVVTYILATEDLVSFPLIPVEFHIGLPLVWAAVLGVIISGASGWLQDWGIWARLRKRGIGNVQQMIVSIGLSLAILNFIQWWIGGRRVRLSKSIDERWHIGSIDLGQQTALSMIISLAALGAVAYFLLRTRLGRATRAVSDNPALAAASGIAVSQIVRLVWVLSAALAGLGGILLALYEQGTAFDAGARMLLLMFAAVTLGGLGHPFGALVGSLVIGLVTELSTIWVGADLKYATALGILILVLLFRPQGILGRAERVG